MEAKCEFVIAWQGKCGNEATGQVDGFKLCKKHYGVKCKGHSLQATRDCGTTYQFVCGTPLCSERCSECDGSPYSCNTDGHRASMWEDMKDGYVKD